MIDVTRETDVDRLREYIRVQQAEIALLKRDLTRLSNALAKAQGSQATQIELEIEMLVERLANQSKRLYGNSSEKRPRSETADGQVDQAYQDLPRRGHGPTEQVGLPILDMIHELAEDERTCANCGGRLEEMTDQYDDADEIDVIERSFRIVRHRRKKYRCRCGECIKTAPAPAKVVAGGRYSLDFACAVTIAKYLEHAPLARQARQMKREGLDVTTQTLWDQVNALAGHLEPTYERLLEYVRESPIVGADETTWRLMDKENHKKKWWAWSLTREDAVVYMIQKSRGADAARRLLGDFTGRILCDGYAAYQALAKPGDRNDQSERPPPLANCWSHVRRKFVEAEPFDARAGEAIALIGKLYEIEAEVDADGRLRARQEHSRPVVEQFRQWMLEQRALPKSALGRAIAYADKLWPGLLVFLDDASIPIDNNATERAMRAVAIGRKNHYGSRSLRGTQVAALCYSLLESAKLAGVDPAQYLRVAARRAIERPGTVTLPTDLRNN